LSTYIREVWPDSTLDAAGAIRCVQPENGTSIIDIPEDYFSKSKFMKFFPNEIDRESFINKVKSDVGSAIGNPNTVILIPNQ
jgi:hypothetical protein